MMAGKGEPARAATRMFQQSGGNPFLRCRAVEAQQHICTAAQQHSSTDQRQKPKSTRARISEGPNESGLSLPITGMSAWLVHCHRDLLPHHASKATIVA